MALWSVVLAVGVYIVPGILVVFGLLLTTLGAVGIIASARAARGRGGLVAIVAMASLVLAYLGGISAFVAHAGPRGGTESVIWWLVISLATTTVVAAAPSAMRRSRA